METVIEKFQIAMPANPVEDLKVTLALDMTEAANGADENLQDVKDGIEEEITSSSIDIAYRYKDGGNYKADDGDLKYAKYEMAITLKFKDNYEDETSVYDLEKLLTKIQSYVITEELQVKKLSTSYSVKPGKPLPIDIDLDDE